MNRRVSFIITTEEALSATTINRNSEYEEQSTHNGHGMNIQLLKSLMHVKKYEPFTKYDENKRFEDLDIQYVTEEFVYDCILENKIVDVKNYILQINNRPNLDDKETGLFVKYGEVLGKKASEIKKRKTSKIEENSKDGEKTDKKDEEKVETKKLKTRQEKKPSKDKSRDEFLDSPKKKSKVVNEIKDTQPLWLKNLNPKDTLLYTLLTKTLTLNNIQIDPQSGYKRIIDSLKEGNAIEEVKKFNPQLCQIVGMWAESSLLNFELEKVTLNKEQIKGLLHYSPHKSRVLELYGGFVDRSPLCALENSDISVFLTEVILLISSILQYDLSLPIYITCIIKMAQLDFFLFVTTTTPILILLKVFHDVYLFKDDENESITLSKYAKSGYSTNFKVPSITSVFWSKVSEYTQSPLSGDNRGILKDEKQKLDFFNNVVKTYIEVAYVKTNNRL
jgi:hypothetical protein